ncbi:hypothetical protein [Streptosporangium pseudovulgare]|uniref:Uncharacterized protein n=1 Tax=Streptosporangium pseudovulgare TaxID=35765 RepID=A0ABQ2R2Z9_9ACTN|nr:hypothetical protein [Streptosporangium pseudovulgare]GGQ11200.1 hypothetical protein GCM10010140_46690 [Streptosporangium pseudovulgare]
MTRDMPAFPAAPYSAVTFPDDEYLVVPASLVEALVPSAAVLLYLLLAGLAEGHREVEVSTAQLERHTGWTGAEIGAYVRALADDEWVTTRPGRTSGTRVYRLLRMPSADQVRAYAEDLDEPGGGQPAASRPSERPAGPAGPKHHAAFWLGRVADPVPHSK